MFQRRKADDSDEWDFPDLPDEPLWEDEWDAGGGRGGRGRNYARLVPVLLAVVMIAAAALWLRGRGGADDSPAAIPLPAVAVAVPQPTALPTSATVAPTAPAATIALASPVGAASESTPDGYDPAALADYMLGLINADRAAAGLSPVVWDETAARAGAAHAADMIARGYFAHWNTEGLGPDHRYALLGGEDAVMENLHAFIYAYEDGGGAPVTDWSAMIAEAEASLMDSPGHRDNILDPAHTHVGIGMAYDPVDGEFRLAQEFVNRYATLTVAPPAEAAAGQDIQVAGRFADGPLSNLILSLALEPWPRPLTVEELGRTNTYTSPAQSVDARSVAQAFDERLTLSEPGLYHLRLFADLPTGQAVVVDRLIQAR